MLTNLLKAPFPWFGGKSDAAAPVWAALGDVPHYVEPFAGSLACLLRRPHESNRAYYSETVTDIDALLVNFWRAVTADPQAVAEAASWPVSEFDKHARSVRLLQWRESEAGARLAGDADFYDARMAGWWAWCVSVQIGAWGGGGPWWPDEEGKLRKRSRGKRAAGEPGVWTDTPHLSGNGRGVNHAGTREPGVTGDFPHLTGNGQGVNRPQLREPGLTSDIVSADYERTGGYHPITMPELRRWMDALCARLRHVRICSGDWTRVVTTGAAFTLPVRQGNGPCGVFLDPPYGDVGRVSLYGAHESLTVAEDVRRWCLENGDNPKFRIVYAGYDLEGAELEAAGWRVAEWFKAGFLKGGMGNVGGSGAHQQKRERLWFSPHCLRPDATPKQRQTGLFSVGMP